ncbi:CDP-diacylglycerol--glycerol-3-phosphate 3-phosphatidyltransferase 2 [Punica granatum]|nr:CDP-diacylglycerol--glycerol-3-phosphate 3-phosphatidyltransferase 2 [Punica granatum]
MIQFKPSPVPLQSRIKKPLMSGLKLTISVSIHGALPYKWLRSTSTSTSARRPLSPSLRPLRSRIPNPSSVAVRGPTLPAPRPQGRRIPPCAPPCCPANISSKTLGSSVLILRQPECSSKCLSYFSSSDSDNRGESVAAKSMASENAKSVPFLNHDDDDQKAARGASPPPSMQDADQNSSKLLTLPTILTLGRVAAVPLFISTFYVDSWWGTTATTSIFIAAAITDWLDGYIARKMQLGSAFGAFLDPVADKLMVAAALVLLCTRPLEFDMFGKVPWLMTVPAIAIIGREITMSAVREWAASQNSKLLEAVAVNNLGKWKTATQMTALTILLATRDCSIGGPGLIGTGVALLYISAGLAVWSLVVYMRKIWKVLLK